MKSVVFIVLVLGAHSVCDAQSLLRDCVDRKLMESGIDPRMQNRWNPRTWVGQIQVQAVRWCMDWMDANSCKNTLVSVSDSAYKDCDTR